MKKSLLCSAAWFFLIFNSPISAQFANTPASHSATIPSPTDQPASGVNDASRVPPRTEGGNSREIHNGLNPTITAPLSITVPKGGERWASGSVENITWTGNYSGTLRLEYSIDLGRSWMYIDTAQTDAGKCSYPWMVPGACSATSMVRITDVADSLKTGVGAAPFLISNKVIVIMGSSTAAGRGPAALDSAWAWRYRRYVHTHYPTFIVVNLAMGGYSTYECMPTGFVPPAGKAAPHTNANITRALSYNPSAIVINLPTNDAYWNYSLTETLNNLGTITAAAKGKNIPVWVTTSQGRKLNQSGQELLIATKDSILSIYKEHAIDFWSGIAGSDGTILPQYDQGDKTHLNSDAHKILCERVIGAGILENAVLVEQAPARLVGKEVRRGAMQ